jgi:hypothetical protein
MRGTRVTKIGTVLGILLLGVAATAMAQEAGSMDFTYGTVSKVMDNKIVLMVYDFDVHADVEATYTTDSETVFEDISSVADLQAGDEVNIEYVEVNGEKVIKNLYKSLGVEESGEGEEAEAMSDGENVEDMEEMEEVGDAGYADGAEGMEEAGADGTENMEETEDAENTGYVDGVEDVEEVEEIEEAEGSFEVKE